MATEVKVIKSEEIILTGRLIKFVRLVLRFVGIDIFSDTWGKGLNLLHMMIMASLYHSFIPNNTFYVYKSWGNMIEFANTVAILSSSTQVAYKYWQMVVWRKEIKELVELMQKVQRDNLVNDKHREISMTYTNYIKIVLASLFALYIIDVTFFGLTPLIFQDPTMLPLFYYFPFLPHEGYPYYHINYFHHVMFLTIKISIAFCVDGFFAFCILRACALIEIVKYDLSLLGNKDERLGGYESDKELLGRCYKMHLEVVHFIKYLNKVYSGICLAQCVSGLVTFAMLPNVIVESLVNSSYGYISAVTGQMLIYCVYGDLILRKSESLLRDLYDNQWYEMDIPDRRSLLIMMSYTQRPLMMTAGGFADLSVMTFVTIMKTAYSYFAVISK